MLRAFPNELSNIGMCIELRLGCLHHHFPLVCRSRHFYLFGVISLHSLGGCNLKLWGGCLRTMKFFFFCFRGLVGSYPRQFARDWIVVRDKYFGRGSRSLGFPCVFFYIGLNFRVGLFFCCCFGDSSVALDFLCV